MLSDQKYTYPPGFYALLKNCLDYIMLSQKATLSVSVVMGQIGRPEKGRFIKAERL